MPEQTPVLDALQTSIIVNRKDQPGQKAWTEWRTGLVLTGGTSAQAGDLALLGANGKFDPSVIPASGGSTVSVNGTPVSDPNFDNTTPSAPSGSANVIWQTDGSGNVSAYYATPQLPQTFSPVSHEWLTGYSATTGLFSASQPAASDLTNGTTGTGAVVLAGSPTLTGTTQVANLHITGTLADGTNSVGTPGFILSTTGSEVQWIAAPSSTTVSVNGTPVSSPNFSNSTPAAPGGFTNVIWQFDGSGNVSAYYATSGTVVTFGQIQSGNNVNATMTVDTGASLSFVNGGVVNANELFGVKVSTQPTTPGQVLTATSTTTADWETPAPSSSVNFVQVTADFGSDTGPITPVTDVTTSVAAPWVTSGSTLLVTITGISTSNHGKDDGLFEGLTGQAEDIVPGVGFTLRAYSPLGSWGKYVFAVVGM